EEPLHVARGRGGLGGAPGVGDLCGSGRGAHHGAPGPALAGVEVRLVEAGGGVAHDAVDEALEPADADPFVAEPVADAEGGEVLDEVEGVARVDAGGELAAGEELLEDGELLRRRVVVDGGEIGR